MEDHVADSEQMRNTIFWLKLILGAISGTASYFILRFFITITFFVFIPALYLATILIVMLFIYAKSDRTQKFNIKKSLRMSLHFTGSWLMIFFVFGVACYYFGW